MRIGVAILAAGKGERVGAPKALLRHRGESLLGRVARLSREAGFSPLVAVTAARADEVEMLVPPASDLSFVRNEAPERGQLSSLALALEKLSAERTTHALSFPVDHALISPATFDAILGAAAARPLAIVIPTFGDRGGHPTLFPRDLFVELREHTGEGGARAILARHSSRIVRIPVDDAGVTRDIDTPTQMRALDVHRVEAFDASVHLAGLERLFEACGSTCFCRYFHFAGDKNDWLARCATEPEENRRELREGATRGSDDTRGVVVLDGEEVVGWMKVAPAAAVRKLYEQRFYRGLSVLQERREGVFVASCALVHPEHRNRGVAHALAGGAVLAARQMGARALEAFPRVTEDRITDEERWTGPASAYLAAGLRPTFAEPPYPVLRIDF